MFQCIAENDFNFFNATLYVTGFGQYKKEQKQPIEIGHTVYDKKYWIKSYSHNLRFSKVAYNESCSKGVNDGNIVCVSKAVDPIGCGAEVDPELCDSRRGIGIGCPGIFYIFVFVALH